MVKGRIKFKDEDDPHSVDNVTAVGPPKSVSEHYWDRKMTAEGTTQLVYISGSKNSEGEKKMIKPIPIILATTNATKIEKFHRFVEIWGWNHHTRLEMYTPKDLGIENFDCPEIYYTYEANAALKADYMKYMLKEDPGVKCDFNIDKDPYIILANDSGLEIPALDNWPGVKTKRCCKGTDMTSAEYILHKVGCKLPIDEDRDGVMKTSTVALFTNFDTSAVKCIRWAKCVGNGEQDVNISRPTWPEKLYTAWDICSPYRVYSNGYMAQCKTYTQMSVDESILYGDYMWKSFDEVMKCVGSQIDAYIEQLKEEEEA